MLDRRGVDVAPIHSIVEPIACVLAAARRADLKIVYLKMAYEPDLSDSGTPDAPNWTKVHGPSGVGDPVSLPDGTTSRVLVRDTWNSDILDELTPEPSDAVVYKHRFSGFYETPLHDLLCAHGVRTLIFTGCTTSVCVESTIRDAFFRDYRCVLLEDCVAEPLGRDLPRSNHDATVLLVSRLFGWVTRSDELIESLGLTSPL